MKKVIVVLWMGDHIGRERSIIGDRPGHAVAIRFDGCRTDRSLEWRHGLGDDGFCPTRSVQREGESPFFLILKFEREGDHRATHIPRLTRMPGQDTDLWRNNAIALVRSQARLLGKRSSRKGQGHPHHLFSDLSFHTVSIFPVPEKRMG